MAGVVEAGAPAASVFHKRKRQLNATVNVYTALDKKAVHTLRYGDRCDIAATAHPGRASSPVPPRFPSIGQGVDKGTWGG
ncbi:uncharacterized protein H6S33_011404 [Morchella sextelata]|uniref:uncharacterized protein n=1 Tax=Morchella sextelata TaxID=1174677 RepID=UPI001D0450CA|nr:uncharacterized protein H6S33_009856 [Morchella sextelata]XP_044696172.1 uncharacterized protein H6S33_011404 [Morchella sextelata]KAH0602282.1 hypothetical protein H6S33_009856 [Morchella sextelata]KAH0610977.1 hypothetical protein H6S33_011404 [Morchella sextelata]